MSQLSAVEYIRTGQIPFFRLPTANFAKSGAEAYAGADAVVLGVPYDGGTTYQPGARLGPYHVRRVSALVQGYHPTTRIAVFERLRVLDGGNVVAPPFNAGASRELIQAEITAVRNAGAVPFIVGGDHSITLPVLRALHKSHGPVALVHFDAHLDTSGPEVWNEPHHHGTFLRHALREGLVDRVHQIGVRATWKDASDHDVSSEHGAVLWGMSDIEMQGAGKVGRSIAAGIEGRPTYVTFDVDAVDPAFAPGTGTPVPGGLSAREALSLVRELAGIDLVGMDVVEVTPALDHADMTCHLAAHLLFEGLTLLAARRANGVASKRA